MYRLGEMSDRQRIRNGVLLLILGSILMPIAIIVVHNAGLPSEEVDPDKLFNALIPQNHWLKGVGYLLAFGASQLMLAGAALLWLLNQRMTWARAAFASFLTWMEMVVIFGIVPSEWLNFSQTDLNWSFQRPVPVSFLDPVPPWLLLGNEVTITWGAVKDAISGTYNLVMLVAAGVFAYQVQQIGKPRPAAPAPEEPVSPYGRPLVRGGS
jgi:hypothetical protein